MNPARKRAIVVLAAMVSLPIAGPLAGDFDVSARQTPACEATRLSLADFELALKKFVPPSRLVAQIAACGTTFILEPEDEERLRRLKADDALIAALSPARQPLAGTKWVTPTDRSEMSWIPGDKQMVGSPKTEKDRDNDEDQHELVVEGFWVDRNEITNAAFKEFVVENPAWRKNAIDRSYHDGNYLKDWTGDSYPPGKGNHPVVYVSWFAAQEYAKWAAKRLPTEAEWERTARAGSKSAYWWGDQFEPERGNAGVEVLPVGDARRMNSWNVLDMAGNVREWTSTLFRNYPYSATDGREAPTAEGNRVVRGGSWQNAEGMLRSANRIPMAPRTTSDQIGFRCAYKRRQQ